MPYVFDIRGLRTWNTLMARSTILRVHPGICLLLLIAGAGCTTATPSSPGPSAIHWEKYSDNVFARAKQQNRLVLMDLEAVWCHWCHVQDEITYSDPKVIALIGSHYIAVKVDQDSRPDLSNRYEDYGWPATIIFNSDGAEIAKRSGYIPPVPMAVMLQAFINDPTPGPSIGKEVKVEFGQNSALPADMRKALQDRLNEGYDPKEAGWGVIHKYLDWDATEYSLMYARSGGDVFPEERAIRSLFMAQKLIDPVWGGVYQYSTDGNWDHPHFEKLMQFQAEIMRAYALAYGRLHHPEHRHAADAIRGFIANFLTSPDGAFYVSQDADVVPGEHSGTYFALDDAGRRRIGVPRVDTHCYARENGWAIRGVLAYYVYTQDPADLDAAKRAAEWVIANRSIDGGGFRHGEKDAAGPYLGDTLAMGRAFLALYEATADRAWLARSQLAADFIWSHFRAAPDDAKQAAGFVTAAVSSSDLLRPRPQVDENISAARFFNLLNRYTGRKQDRAAADEAMRFLAAPQVALSRHLFVAGLLIADTEISTEPLHLTIVGRKDDPAAKALFMEALKAPTGYRRVEWFDQAEGKLPNADVEYPTLPTAAAFVCTGNTCSSPMTDTQRLAAKLAHRH